MEPEERANLEAEIGDQLRRVSELRRLLLIYVNERVMNHQSKLSVPLLTERESDTLRGNIAELNKLATMIKNGGTQ